MNPTKSPQFLTFFLVLILECWNTLALKNITVKKDDKSILYHGPWANYDGGRGIGKWNAVQALRNESGNATFTFTGVAMYYIAPRWVYRTEITTQISLDQSPLVIINHQVSPSFRSSFTASHPSAKSGVMVKPSVLVAFTDLTNDTHSLFISSPINLNDTLTMNAVVNSFVYTILEPKDDPNNVAPRLSPKIRPVTIGLAVLGSILVLVSAYCLWKYFPTPCYRPSVVPLHPDGKQPQVPRSYMDGKDDPTPRMRGTIREEIIQSGSNQVRRQG